MCVPMREYQNGHTHLNSAQVVSKEEKSCVRVYAHVSLHVYTFCVGVAEIYLYPLFRLLNSTQKHHHTPNTFVPDFIF